LVFFLWTAIEGVDINQSTSGIFPVSLWQYVIFSKTLWVAWEQKKSFKNIHLFSL